MNSPAAAFLTVNRGPGFEILPRPMDFDRIGRITVQAEFVAGRLVNRETHPRHWLAEYNAILSALLDFEMQEAR